MADAPGIYVHLPFCEVHCSYCDFPLTTRLSLSDRYYRALLDEIRINPAPEADTLFFGGGTPSLTPVGILRQIRGMFSLQQESEITLEANPDHVNRTNLVCWREIGINRLSIGVQSLQPEVLKQMLRRHSPEEALQAIRTARSAGFENISVDLIIGAPLQTYEGFAEGLRQLLDLAPDHFSLYLLEVHEGTALSRQIKMEKTEIMSDELQVECYSAAVVTLQKAGYSHYEVSNFALPGFASRHNLKYWTNLPYFGYGAGACSYSQSIRTANIKSIQAYIDASESGQQPVAERTEESEETVRRNALIFGLRKTAGVRIEEFEKQYGVSPLLLFNGSANQFLESKHLEITEGSLRLTFSGMLVSNEILDRLV